MASRRRLDTILGHVEAQNVGADDNEVSLHAQQPESLPDFVSRQGITTTVQAVNCAASDGDQVGPRIPKRRLVKGSPKRLAFKISPT